MTITREQLLNQARENVKSLKLAVAQTAFKEVRPAIEVDLELARIALASLEARAVAFYQHDGNVITVGSFGFDVFPGKTINLYAAPPAPVPMKDHQTRELVSELRDIAVEYHATQQLRGRIARAVRAAMQGKIEPREVVRREHAEWSKSTFGNVGPVGPLKHLAKEALETAAEPADLSEWADMQFLLWDAQRRAGIADEQITEAMIEKLAVNKARQWPEPKDGEPRLHIKAGPTQEVKGE